ncbi:MAG TPA: DUF1810 domain-containing protein [Terracidiphilus sp.]|nr:DUF1810 domain-containing protein [Terracidiphilus sp.]
MKDPFHLERFLTAQAEVYAGAVEELREGHKQSHWMWFIFPQMKGLGRSPQADYFAIGSMEEATAYLEYPLLGARLRMCTRLVNAVEDRSAHEIFGSPDDLKFHSSMTLFDCAAEDDAEFQAALDKYFRGEPDRLTLELLK